MTTVRICAERAIVEWKVFFRNWQAAFFTFLLPILILVVFGSMFRGRIPGPAGTAPVSFPQLMLAGMIGSTVFSTAFSGMAIGVAIEQHEGLLKRLAATPLPRTAYFVGKIAATLAVSLFSVTIMIALGVLAFDIRLPARPAQWATFVAVYVEGYVACAALGLAYTRLIPNSRAAPAIVQPPFLVLFFISGTFSLFTEMPGWLQQTAALFPLKWLAQAMRYVFLPAWFGAREPAGGAELGRVHLVLLAWIVAGLGGCLVFFRWHRRADR
jgi:ABC-2 type transport system permease protein